MLRRGEWGETRIASNISSLLETPYPSPRISFSSRSFRLVATRRRVASPVFRILSSGFTARVLQKGTNPRCSATITSGSFVRDRAVRAVWLKARDVEMITTAAETPTERGVLSVRLWYLLFH